MKVPGRPATLPLSVFLSTFYCCNHKTEVRRVHIYDGLRGKARLVTGVGVTGCTDQGTRGGTTPRETCGSPKTGGSFP